MKSPYTTIDEYIEDQDIAVQPYLKEIRAIIQKHAPMAQEKISWGMPTYVFHGNLVHFAAQKKHTGFYPGEEGVSAFKEVLNDYVCSKGAIQFPYNKPLPTQLIAKIVTFRVKQNQAWAAEKKKSRNT